MRFPDFLDDPQYGETGAFLHMKEEFREFERRLTAIPGAVAGKVVA